ncbi:hypothetical protein [Tenacibaculum maritimum]|uniref:hypothetical protein n=1 Tax=Tenacibaculum maritimum TaxID=107401 RepID=UPI0012E3FE19|nr:hypothetical protein [Tenacibaculum maritimum]CAA0204519.1 conserved hypothetical protein [Tenacibaculum maritimum]
MEDKILKLYDFDMSFGENFLDNEDDKHIVIRISLKDNKVDLVLDKSSICVSSPKDLMHISKLSFLAWDYDSIFGTRYNVFKKYDKDFFDCQERVLFEALIIRFKRNHFKPFRWEKTKIGMELGIKRNKRDNIIRRFTQLGIIKSALVRQIRKGDKFSNSYFFDLDTEKIIELLPKIFSEFDFKKVESNLITYFRPDLNIKLKGD